MFRTKNTKKIKTHVLLLNDFLYENLSIYETDNVEKYGRGRSSTDNNTIRHKKQPHNYTRVQTHAFNI
jgi:hypothetical protein